MQDKQLLEVVGALEQCREALRTANHYIDYRKHPRVPSILLDAAKRADKVLKEVTTCDV